MAGVTTTGFETKRLPDIQSSINEKAISKFGEGINLEDDSLLGQIRDIVASELTDLWDAMQATYDSGTPSRAEGINLDDVSDRVGIRRLDAKPSIATVMFTGTNGSNIPAATIVAVNTTDEEFYTVGAVTINPGTCHSTIIDITVVSPTTPYTVTISGSVYTITSGGSPTANAIATSLANAINLDVALPATASVVSNRLSIVSDIVDSTLSITTSVNTSFYSITTPVLTNSVNTGKIQAPVNQLNTLRSSVSGISSVTNLVPAAIGRNAETDTELRLRRARSLAIAGTTTIDAIKAKVGQVDSVVSVAGTSNRTSAIVDSLPAHSFEIIVQGGTDTEIAQTIWDSMPAGIESYGSYSATVYDSSGLAQVVYFTRPSEVDMYVDVVYSVYSEEDFPATGEAAIAVIVLAIGNQLSIGNDVIAQRFFGEIYKNVPGIQDLSITLSTTAGTPPYGSVIVPISNKQIPVFDSSRITVGT